MVDWSLAHQAARLVGGSPPAPGPAARADFAGLARRAEALVAGYTGIAPSQPVPAAEAVDRGRWAEINIETLRTFLDPVVGRLSAHLDRAGPLAGPLRAAAGATLAFEVGLVTGYMSQRVLGQYELSLLQPEERPRLLFVVPNLDNALRELDVDADAFLAWVALHEVTHAFQFSGVPWLRGHLAALLREYLSSVEVRVERGPTGGLPTMPSLDQLAQRFREGGLAALVQTGEQRELMRRLQATMAVIEGYSEHVMDVVGERELPAYAGLREAMEKRRASRSTPQRLLERLLGFDMKLLQYELGKRFCDAVAGRGGIELLDRVWESPEAIPSMGELRDPGAWVTRIEGSRAAA